MSEPKSQSAKLACVIGWPVRQSVSPVLHAHWLRQHNIAGTYVALPVRPEDFGKVIGILPLMGFVGANVTVPHKEAAFALSATLDEDAKATGAVNMLVFQDGLVHGHNTDVRGFAAHLEQSVGPAAVRKGPAVVLGAGGAARSIVLALLRLGVKEIRILNRTKPRAEALAALFAGQASVSALDWTERDLALSGANLLVNTTALGMTGKDRLELPLGALPKTAIVADIVYNPLQTDLLVRAKARGNVIVDGLGMLMHQAVPAFEAWFGTRPEVTADLRAELEETLSPSVKPKRKHAAPPRPLVVGLTGSIGMGKTETGKMFARLGIPVHDSDHVVHELYGVKGAAVAPLRAAFPDVVTGESVDRAALAKHLTSDPSAFALLDSIVHPLVRAKREEFLARAAEEGQDIVVLDIPLLFETGSEKEVDAVVVASAPAEIQRQRVMARPGMTEEKFAAIAARQTPDDEKRAKADYIIETGSGLEQAFEMVERVVADLRGRAAKKRERAPAKRADKGT